MSHIKIYFEDKPLIIAKNISPELQSLRGKKTLWLDAADPEKLNALPEVLSGSEYDRAVLIDDFYKNVKKVLLKEMHFVVAAGGLVQNQKKEILMIFRRGKWDLPKGKLDEGESLETCAVREVEEETGLKNVQLLNYFHTTFHFYEDKGRRSIKESHWYILNCEQTNELKPQTEEDITEAVWVPVAELPNYFEGAFPLISDLLQKYLRQVS